MTAQILRFPVNRVLRWPHVETPACGLCGSDEGLVGVEIDSAAGKTVRCWWCDECLATEDDAVFGDIFGKDDPDR